MALIDKQLVTVKLGSVPEEAALLLLDGELLALVVWLDPGLYGNDPAIGGKWSVELGFGPCLVRNETVLFGSLDEAAHWAETCAR